MIGVIFSQVLYHVSVCYGIIGTKVVDKPEEGLFLRSGRMAVHAFFFRPLQNGWWYV